MFLLYTFSHRNLTIARYTVEYIDGGVFRLDRVDAENRHNR